MMFRGCWVSKVTVDTWGGHIDESHLDVRKGIVSLQRRKNPHLKERGMGSCFTRPGYPEVADHETHDESGRTVCVTDERTSANIDDVMRTGRRSWR